MKLYLGNNQETVLDFDENDEIQINMLITESTLSIKNFTVIFTINIEIYYRHSIKLLKKID